MQAYSTSDLTVALITVRFLQKLGRYCQQVNEHCRSLTCRNSISCKLKDVEIREVGEIYIPNRFAALENLESSGDINMAWENV